MSHVGTWDWAEQTAGSLRRRDRLRLIGQGVSARLAQLPSPWRSRLLGEHAPLTLPKPPDSPLARNADERVRELSSPALYGHCQRTWMFAELFAQRDHVQHDEELLSLTPSASPSRGRAPHTHWYTSTGQVSSALAR